jgi:transcriptional regulator with XRE-family HTH domain
MRGERNAHFEAGRRKPSFDNVRALAKALKVSADYLLGTQAATHQYEREVIFRCCPDVPKDFFKLDDTRKIMQLKGMGASSARKERPRIEPVFLTDPAGSFKPEYTLKGIEP